MPKKLFVAFLFALSAALVSFKAQATHFRYGNITYTVSDPVAAPKTVRFDVTVAWRTAFIDSTVLVFGDGQQNPSTQGFSIGSGVDTSGEQYTVMRYVATHTYAGTGPYIAYFTSCCRISTLTNAPDDDFRVEARVDLTPGNKGNAVASVPPIIQLQTGGLRTLFIPAIDPDGPAVSCRFGTPAESGMLAGANPPTVPGGSTATVAPSANPPGCNVTWNTANGVAGQKYAMQVVMESLNGPALASAAVDFIIEFVSNPPPTCAGTGSFTVDMGQAFMTTMTGTNNSGGASLKMTSIGWFSGLTPPSGSSGASPMTVTLTSTPGPANVGTQVSTILFTDQLNTSGYCSISITVPPCPQYGQSCSVGIGACQSQGTLQCTGGSVVCNAVAKQPTPEVCDGLDNNCDGSTDEGNPDAGQPCGTGLPGLCATGTTNCGSGSLECIPDVNPGSVAETCNGIDDDCDGMSDDGFNVGMACSAGTGACKDDGAIVCDGAGGAICNAMAGNPGTETCNGIDDDCDGSSDEDFPLGMACMVGVGACEASGVIACNGGAAACNAVPGQPELEVCGNTVDEDCDGETDNGCGDSDGDGLFDPEEEALGLDPADADTDDDGVIDGDEPSYDEDTDGDGLINALDPDSDDDGLYDGTELGLDCDDPATKESEGHCVPDADGSTTTDPLSRDSDEAGATDGSEDPNLNGAVDDGETDPNGPGDDGSVADDDDDGLGDKLEAFLGSVPDDADSDNDGALNGVEANPADDTDGDGLVNLLDVDSDNDALFDGTEMGADCAHRDTDAALEHCRSDADSGTKTTSPVNADTDGGGATDGSEDANLNGAKDGAEKNPNNPTDDGAVADADGDGLGDTLEETLGSEDHDADSDDDGLLDGDEANPSDDHDGDGEVNALDADSDGDGLFDGTEAGKNCSDPDTNASNDHCIADGDGSATKTSGVNEDTDGGGALDGDEDLDHDGVVDDGERDPNDPSDDGNETGCKTDGECGDAASGKVCDPTTAACVPGCRGSNGNACPANQVCSSTDDTVGTCSAPPPPSDAEPADDGGCSCRTASEEHRSALAAWLLVAAAALGVRRRRAR